jgi:hypothetical protein
MDPEINETPTETSDDQPQGEVASKPLTEADVQRMITEATKRARDSAYAEARRMFEKGGKAKEPPKAEKQPRAESQGIDNRKLRVFDRAVAKLGLSDKAIERMERAFEVDDPDDVSQWVAEYTADFGIKVPSADAPSAATQNATPAPKPAPSAAPSASIPTDRPQDVTKWDDAMLRQYVLRKGGNPHDLADPRNSKLWDEIAEMYRQTGAQKRIVNSPRR